MLTITSNNRDKLHKIRMTMLMTAIPVEILEITGIILLAVMNIWWPLALYIVLAIPYSVWLSKYYFGHVAYMCPHCNRVFTPKFSEALWAAHTLTKRKLTCPDCGKKEWCTEVAKEEA